MTATLMYCLFASLRVIFLCCLLALNRWRLQERLTVIECIALTCALFCDVLLMFLFLLSWMMLKHTGC